MNEPPGARARVGLTGLTVAEHFRDAEGQDVLLFIDNIFRFTQVSLFTKDLIHGLFYQDLLVPMTCWGSYRWLAYYNVSFFFWLTG